MNESNAAADIADIADMDDMDETAARDYMTNGRTWEECAMEVVRREALESDYFTTDLIWCLLDHDYSCRARDRRAISGVMRKAVAERVCRPTKFFRKDIDLPPFPREAGGRPRRLHRLRIWESLLRGPVDD